MNDTLNDQLKEKIKALKNKKVRSQKSIMLGGESFLLKRGEVGCFLLHGWSSTPQELKELGEHLANNNISIYAPLLPGHGTSPDDLKRYVYQDWIDYAKEELRKFKQEVKTVFVGGISMGGDISFHLAKDDTDIRGVISMGTPALFKYNSVLKLVYPLFKLLNITVKKHYPVGREKKILLKNKVHYRRYPLKSAAEAFKMGWSLKKVLPHVRQPTLVMQSNTDLFLKEKNAYYIYQNLGATEKKLVWIPNSYHVFTMDYHKEKAFHEVYQFIVSNLK